MNLPDLKNLSIEPYRNREEVIRQVAAQIEKDFDQFGLEVKFSGEIHNAYEELFNQLNEHIAYLLDRDYHRLVLLLYQIDVNEKQIIRTELDFPDVPKSELLTELIILRELKKVLIRNYFKENPDKL
ncbi:hypothetical protein BZG02_10975 [Labilibaculum filiforme]|uniref:Uncharacterized protein n=1 Tax=Labilibaculum filiforme TaxID=1940526 RepID=A0A2N3HXG9_9BACT|nr:hypothetical protein [Labilibaculum filiforme]PKQ62727.1 hypothetical protein BZG02_10975 [Labilibaculum filiforme]